MSSRRETQNGTKNENENDDDDNNNSSDNSYGELSLLQQDASAPSTAGTSMKDANKELVRLVTVAAATAATLGYDVGIMAAAIQPIEVEMNLTGFQKELAMGSLNFVAAAGALLGGAVADKRGRKPTLQLCCWLFVAGTLLMGLAPEYYSLLLGRIVTGIGVGVSFVVAPVFISEVAPTHLRGQLNTVFDVAINGGILLGYIVGYLVQITPLQDQYKWRLMLSLGIVLPIVVLGSIAVLPESPRWLMLVHQEDAAGAVLRRLGSSELETQQTISAIAAELELERRQGSLLTNHQKWTPGRRLAVSLGFWQQATGTEAVLYYSADFLARAGLESPTRRLLGNVFVGICKLVPELVAMAYVDKIGRRPLMIASSALLFTSTAGLSIAFKLEADPIWIVVLLCCVMASFSTGLGPFTFLLASENLATSERAAGMTWCAAANRCTSGAVALSTVSLYQVFGDSGFFAFYTAVGFASLVFYVSIVETSGLTLEELSAGRRGSNNFGAPDEQEEYHDFEIANVQLDKMMQDDTIQLSHSLQ
jgi:sugar porter (SP) family MFS transporter